MFNKLCKKKNEKSVYGHNDFIMNFSGVRMYIAEMVDTEYPLVEEYTNN